MSLKLDYFTLNEFDIESIRLKFDKVHCLSDEVIIHRGHIPRFGIILLDGMMIAKFSRKEVELPKLSIHGVRELYHNQPLKYSIQAFQGTELFCIDRSTTLSILNGKEDDALNRVFGQFLLSSAV